MKYGDERGVACSTHQDKADSPNQAKQTSVDRVDAFAVRVRWSHLVAPKDGHGDHHGKL